MAPRPRQGLGDPRQEATAARPLPAAAPALVGSSADTASPAGAQGRWAGTFEGLATDLAEVGAALLVAAGHVPQQRPLLSETLLAELAAEGPLAGVRAVVLVQAGCGGGESARGGLGHSSRGLGRGAGEARSPWVRKVLPQRWHWKGFSPVCVRRCVLRLAFWVKAWLQNSQT